MESPQDLLSRVREMLTDQGHLFITTPTNAPTIDHIYLFRNTQEIRDLVQRSGFSVVEEVTIYAEEDEEQKPHATTIYGAFLKKKLF